MANKKNQRPSTGSRKSTRLLKPASPEVSEANMTLDITEEGGSEGGIDDSPRTCSLTPEELADMEDVPDANHALSDDEDLPAAVVPTKSRVILKVPSPSPVPASESGTKSKKATAKGANAAGSSKKRKAVDDSDSEDVPPPKKPKLVLLIPLAESEVIERVNVDWDASFDDIVQTIYETIPCTDVKKKPILSYKFGTAKGPSYALKTDHNWEGCLEMAQDASSATKGKKGALSSVSIVIELGPKNYLESLRSRFAKKGKSKALAPATGRKKANLSAANLLDLDEDDEYGLGDDEEQGDESDPVDAENRQLAILEGVLSKCQLCGSSVFCKINKAGAHVALNFAQRKGWAKALAMGVHDVTLRNPPKAPMFAEFHGPQKQGTASSAHTSPDNSYGPPPPWHAMYSAPPFYYGLPPPYHNHPGGPAVGSSQQPLQRTKTLTSESDAPVGVRYTGLYEFFEHLHHSNPNRAILETITDTFYKQEVESLWEIARLGKDSLKNNFDMTIGTASFIIDEVQREIKRCIRAHKQED